MAACIALREYEGQVDWARKLVALSPTDVHALLVLLCHAVRQARASEANKAAQRVNRRAKLTRTWHRRLGGSYLPIADWSLVNNIGSRHWLGR
jgi:hypothetical protein